MNTSMRTREWDDFINNGESLKEIKEIEEALASGEKLITQLSHK